MKKFTTPTVKSLVLQTTNRLNQTLVKTAIGSFERTALLSVKAILDSYEWLLYAVGKTPDVYATWTIQFDFESTLEFINKLICKVEMNRFCDSAYESIDRASKDFTTGRILLHLNRLENLIRRTEKINDEAEYQCEKAWHEHENASYWLHFLKKEVQKTT